MSWAVMLPKRRKRFGSCTAGSGALGRTAGTAVFFMTRIVSVLCERGVSVRVCFDRVPGRLDAFLEQLADDRVHGRGRHHLAHGIAVAISTQPTIGPRPI